MKRKKRSELPEFGSVLDGAEWNTVSHVNRIDSSGGIFQVDDFWLCSRPTGNSPIFKCRVWANKWSQELDRYFNLSVFSSDESA